MGGKGVENGEGRVIEDLDGPVTLGQDEILRRICVRKASLISLDGLWMAGEHCWSRRC